MRVVIVGPEAERAEIRARAGAPLDIVGEFPSVAAARAADVDFDAILMAPGRRAARGEDAFAEPLTAREIQVLELLAEGLANKAIAERLGISDQTVKFHVAAISGKLGAANRTDTVRRAVRQGLITL
jgi:DNA-binding NarL/FixJ family response regulator